MKISVQNFKSIRSIDDYPILPVNLLAGVNSSGKTSLIQVLLLIKQTIENHTKAPLLLTGEYFTAPTFQDIFYLKGTMKDGIKLSFLFEQEDIQNMEEYRSYANSLNQLRYSVVIKSENETPVIYLVSLEIFEAENEEKPLSIRFVRKESGKYKGLYEIQLEQGIRAYNLVGYGQSVGTITSKDRFRLDFTNLFPLYGEKVVGGERRDTVTTFSFLSIKNIHSTFLTYFERICYIGPVRIKPEPIISYTQDDFPNVGIDGKFTRFLLYKHFRELREDTEKWICGNFQLAKSLEVRRDGNRSYRIMVKYHDVEVDICHMGLGISQVLPIVVQGLLLPEGSLFIVDSPEVHLHPSIQSAIMDFFIMLAVQRKVNVLIETHSDHCVTRIRRRIVEKELKAERVNLRYVTNDGTGSEYELQKLTADGMFASRLPDGFLDTQDKDFEEIIKRQLD